ncbi:DUF6485 family protein [Proteiniborus sp. MB09-C3]|uniref:DUF6485 family protein n=1 Tax=Proteiniborus sp. MB09-C3 TaxID=3050072 RepID=UPI002557B41A|nr:DUF6485 family protein [Proteiniborus sp. MB09-C3]WIV13697.1 DUF6485 family protein [Proteiniborus sp. MB09-C3]
MTEKHTHFCTCKDLNCKLNPHNHDLGCDPCIRKNLKQGEIPSCFFHLIQDDLSQLSRFDIESFIKLYIENQKD